MDLKLANDVVYAILAAVIAFTLIVYTTRIIRIKTDLRYDEWAPQELERSLEQQQRRESGQTTNRWPSSVRQELDE